MRSYPDIKKNEILSFAETSVELEDIMVSKIGWAQDESHVLLNMVYVEIHIYIHIAYTLADIYCPYKYIHTL
jgi:hypothetical protein